MVQSMTAFASRTGSFGSTTWTWDMRGVNGRGLDLKLRIPEGLSMLETPMRNKAKASLSRGIVTINLRLKHEEMQQGLALDPTQLESVLRALDDIQNQAFSMGVTLSQPSTADVLAQRGVLVASQEEEDLEALQGKVKEDFEALLKDFVAMRAAEGDALEAVLTDQLAQISSLTDQAQIIVKDRATASRDALRDGIDRILGETKDVDAGRLEQELALLAVKQDVTEEIDRLRAHVDAAVGLLKADGPMGRKLDFLSQEFNREANTLCAKSQYAPLTAIGLELKAVIDQMREQIQNVE